VTDTEIAFLLWMATGFALGAVLYTLYDWVRK
jgi:hypothetical protein